MKGALTSLSRAEQLIHIVSHRKVHFLRSSRLLLWRVSTEHIVKTQGCVPERQAELVFTSSSLHACLAPF